MPRDKSANHIKLMAAAREEFLIFGFEKASMRSIGERCGMTAAGLYRHCRDKEDLFDQLVSPSIERLNTWLKEHVERYVNDARSSREPQWRDSWTDMMREVVYPHMEDYILLVAKSGGDEIRELPARPDGDRTEAISFLSACTSEIGLSGLGHRSRGPASAAIRLFDSAF